jgi:CRP/FNR family transcriptional regulator
METAAAYSVTPLHRAPYARKDEAPASAPTIRCSACHLRPACLPSGLVSQELEMMSELVITRRRVKRGDMLYRAGEPFKFLYALRTGFFKSYAITEDGREQVTGFPMAGEVIGMDGIENERHRLNVEALEDCEVCVIPFSRLEDASTRIRALQHQFFRLLSREIVRDQGVMTLLGTMRAEERVAAFLLNLSHRFVALGYAASEFNLRMTREDIGSYLGLKLETISRMLSKFQQWGLINIQQKNVRILDVNGLKDVMGQPHRC